MPRPHDGAPPRSNYHGNTTEVVDCVRRSAGNPPGCRKIHVVKAFQLPLALLPALSPGPEPSPLPVQDPTPAEAPRTGHLAPPLGEKAWLARQQGFTLDPSLAFFHGKVVLVHPVPAEAGDPTLELLADLAEACEDRDLRLVGLAAEGSLQSWKLAGLGVSWPVAEVVPGESAWWPAEGRPPVAVVGRAGEVRWSGAPLDDEQAFLEAVDTALRLPRGPRLAADPGPELAEVAEALWQADWLRAEKEARKAEKSLSGQRDEASRAAARRAEDVLAALERHGEDLLAEATGAVRADQGLVYWRARTALEQGFPRSPWAREAKALEKEAMRSNLVLVFVDAEKYLTDVHPERPILFPVRRSPEGDRFVRTLEKFVKASDNAAGTTLHARRMLERYAEAE